MSEIIPPGKQPKQKKGDSFNRYSDQKQNSKSSHLGKPPIELKTTPVGAGETGDIQSKISDKVSEAGIIDGFKFKKLASAYRHKEFQTLLNQRINEVELACKYRGVVVEKYFQTEAQLMVNKIQSEAAEAFSELNNRNLQNYHQSLAELSQSLQNSFDKIDDMDVEDGIKEHMKSKMCSQFEESLSQLDKLFSSDSPT